MLQQDEFDLLQKSADGELTAEEGARLEALLTSSEEARHVAAILAALEPDGAAHEYPPANAVLDIINRIESLPQRRQAVS